MNNTKKHISKSVSAHKKIKSHKNMEKVKIKRVRREKKHVTAKEKILAGIGVGGALMGGAGAVAPKSGQTQIVRTQESPTKKTSKFKDALKRIFGIGTAKASVTQEYLDSLAANVNAAKAALASFDQWVTEATADAQNFGTQEERDNRLAEIQATVDAQRPGLVSAQEAAESAYSTAADEFINQQNGGGGNGGVVTTHSYSLTAGAATLAVEQGSGGGMTYTLTDNGQNIFPMLGISATADDASIADVTIMNGMVQVNGKNPGETNVTISYQGETASFRVKVTALPGSGGGNGGGGTVAHSYNLTAGSGSLTVEQGATGGMTYALTDNGQNIFPMLGLSATAEDPSIVNVSLSNGTIIVNGKNPGETDVKIAYQGVETTFHVVVTALPGSGGGNGGGGGGAVTTHSYTLTTGDSELTVQQGSGGGMTYTLQDNGQTITPILGISATAQNPNIVSLQTMNGMVEVIGVNAGSTYVTISYQGVETTFHVTVTAPEVVVGPGPAVTTPLQVSAGAQTMSVVAGEYREFYNTFSVTNGSGNYSYTLSQSPWFIGINGNDGAIFVNSAAEAGSYTVQVNVTDNQDGRTGSVNLTVTITAAPAPVADPVTPPTQNNYQAGNLANVPVMYVKASVNVMAHRTISINGVGLVAIIESGEIYDENGQDITGKFSTEDQQKIYNAAYGSGANLQNPQEIPGASFTTTSGQSITSGSSLKAGDSWKLQIKNYRAGASVTARTTFAGQTSETNLGQTDANGNFNFTGTETENEVGTWQVEFLVDGQSVISSNFEVVTAGTKTGEKDDSNKNLGAGVSFTKNGASFTTLKVWEPWEISITGAKANAQIIAQTTQVRPTGETKTSTRVLGKTDANGILQITDTPTADHIGTWTMQLLADGQPLGGTASFTVVSSTIGPAPVDASGKIKAGWQTDGGGRYYNNSTGIYSNADGTVQGYTSDQYGRNLIEAGKVQAGVTDKYSQTVKAVYIYNNYDHTFQKANEGQFSTLDVANQMAAIFGGKVQASQLSASGPYRFVNVSEMPAGQTDMQEENLLPSFEVVVGKYRGNAAAMAHAFQTYPYDQAVAMIQAEIDAENNPTGQINPSVTNPPKGGTQAAGTSTDKNSPATQASIKVSISTIKSYDTTGASSPTKLGAGYKVEITGENLDSYQKAYVVIGSSQVEITNFKAQSGKLTLTLPSSLPAGIASGATVNIKITSDSTSVPQGTLKQAWQYVATASPAGDLNLEDEAADVDSEESDAALDSSSGEYEEAPEDVADSNQSANSGSGSGSYSGGVGNSSYDSGASYNNGSSGGGYYTDNSSNYGSQNSPSYQSSPAYVSPTVDSEAESEAEESSDDEEVETTDGADNNTDNKDEETEVTDEDNAGDSEKESEEEDADTETENNDETEDTDEEKENDDKEDADSDTETEAGDSESDDEAEDTEDESDDETESGDTEDNNEDKETEESDDESENNDSEKENDDSDTESQDDEEESDEETEGEDSDKEDSSSGDAEMEAVDAEDISSGDKETEESDTASGDADKETENDDSETTVASGNKISMDDSEAEEAEEEETSPASGSGGGSSSSSSGGGGGVYTLGSASQLAGSQFNGLQMPAGYGSSGGGLQYQAPVDEQEETDAESESESESESDGGILVTYKVKKGDTLWKIAKKYYGDGKKWRKILEANTDKVKNTRTMKIGIELKIPKI